MGAVILAIDVVFGLGYLLLIVRAALPWLPLDQKSGIIMRLKAALDPLLGPIRLGLPPDKIGFDFSPFAGIIALWLLQGFIIHYLLGG